MPLKVLIVEDNPTARTTLEKLLAIRGFRVQTARTLCEGRQKLDGHAAVILDLDLPDGCGVELLKKIRIDQLPIKVLIVSASVDPALWDDVQALHPDAVLEKPLDFPALLKHLSLPVDYEGERAPRPARGGTVGGAAASATVFWGWAGP